MQYILASVMLFKSKKLLLVIGCWLLLTVPCYAEIIDRVVAHVGNTIITLSEFQENYHKIQKTMPNTTKEEVIKSMVNRLLLIKEAERMRLEAPTDEELLKDYIDIRIKSLVIIREDEIRAFYDEHIDEFRGKDYLSVRDEIEKYLFELEVSRRLQKHLKELRANTGIKIQLTPY